MLPTFALGAWQVHTYSLANAVAMLVAGMYAFHRLLRLDTSAKVVMYGLFYTVVAGFAGVFVVRAVPTVQHWLLTGDPVWAAGSSFAGAVVSGSLVAVLYCRKHAISLGRAFDLGGLPLPLGQAIGRLGCFAAGCCHGRPTTSPLGIYLPDDHGAWTTRYPTQLLASGADLLILAVLLAVDRTVERRHARPFDGLIFLLYLILYSLKRFVLEFLRADGIPIFGQVTWVHLYTLVAIGVSTGLILWRLKQRHPQTGMRGLATDPNVEMDQSRHANQRVV